MFAEEEALVRGVDDDGVPGEPPSVERIEYAPDLSIEGRDDAHVVRDEALVFPASERIAVKSGGVERLVFASIPGVPGRELIGREIVWRLELQIAADEVERDFHFRIARYFRAVRSRVPEGRRHREGRI